MKNFDSIIEFIIDNLEGGYQNNSKDSGNRFPNKKNGILLGTKYGITPIAYYDYTKKIPTIEIMKNLSKDIAKEIYKVNYWNEISGDLFEYKRIVNIVFDIAINSGVYRASLMLQRAINKIIEDNELNIALLIDDGDIGNKTITAMNKLCDIDEDTLYETILQDRKDFYFDLAKRKPEYSCFLSGWLRRVELLNNYNNSI